MDTLIQKDIDILFEEIKKDLLMVLLLFIFQEMEVVQLMLLILWETIPRHFH